MRLSWLLKIIGLLLTFHNQTIKSSAELPLIISVCSYNNSAWVNKNLDSIFMQQYENFHIVYIDDASSDDTVLKVQDYIEKHHLQNKITLIANPTRQRKLKNIYNAFHACPDNAIIVQVDGDDWLADDQVFISINNRYANQDIWLTYGQYELHPSNKLGCCKAVPRNVKKNRSYRKHTWVYTHLRTFYAWLFKAIKLEDFITESTPGYEGKFFPVANDNASYFPMLEMCGNKFEFIPDILYIHNRDNPNYGHAVEKSLYVPAQKDIRLRSKYPVVKEPLMNKAAQYKNEYADLVILSKDNSSGVKALLHSLADKVTGISKIYILYEENKNTVKSYHALQNEFPQVQFIPTLNISVNAVLHDLVQTNTQKHILVAKDTTIVVDSFDVHKCIIELERTFAYGFYFGFAHSALPFYSLVTDSDELPHEHIYKDMYTWKFGCGPSSLCNNLDMTLLRKDALLERIGNLANSNTLDSFINKWEQATHSNMHNVGLFFEGLKIKQL